MDRRTRKSREAIFDAFIALMEEKRFEHITINEIAEKADVNRGTVYLHFTDKFDLLNQCVEMHLENVFADCLDSNIEPIPSKRELLRAFQHVEQHRSLYITLLNNESSSTFRKRTTTVIQHLCREYINNNFTNHELNKEMLTQFLSSAIVGVAEWWIGAAMEYPATEVIDEIWQLLTMFQHSHGISSYGSNR